MPTPGVTDAVGEAGQRRYWAFLSYSHADEAWARWLHRTLEQYRVPRRLVGRPHPGGAVPRHVRPVFRDRDELGSSHRLSAAIRQALQDSRDLIVLCSPAAAASRHVNDEIRWFQSLGRGDRIRCLIVGGEPGAGAHDCFPPALRSSAGNLGEATSFEPIAADVRPGKDGKAPAALKILAGMLDVPYDELRRRDQRRKRQQRTLAGFGLVALLVVMFVLLADAGLGLPYGEAARAGLDRAGVTLFRPAPDRRRSLEAAAPLRKRLIAILQARRRDNGMYSWGPGKDDGIDAWATAQVLAALSRAPETAASDWPSLRQTIDALFSEPYWQPVAGGPKGWRFKVGRPANGNVAPWVVSALAAILSREDLLPESDRSAVLAHYETAVETVAELSPLQDGGWNMFAGQDDPADHNFYTGVLALEALLGAHLAGLTWSHGEPPLPELSLTVKWLIAGFDGTGPRAGWRRTPQDQDAVQDGLTLQIHCLLLQAEEAGVVTLPADLVEQLTRHLVSLVERDKDFPAGAADFNAFLDGTDEGEGVILLWYPSAVHASDLWLRRSQRASTAREDVRRVQRTLGHLLVDMGDGLVDMYTSEATFRAAELLWNLGPLDP